MAEKLKGIDWTQRVDLATVDITDSELVVHGRDRKGEDFCFRISLSEPADLWTYYIAELITTLRMEQLTIPTQGVGKKLAQDLAVREGLAVKHEETQTILRRVHVRLAHKDPAGFSCPDCGVAAGEHHLKGCGQESCPKCSRKFNSCGCDILFVPRYKD